MPAIHEKSLTPMSDSQSKGLRGGGVGRGGWGGGGGGGGRFRVGSASNAAIGSGCGCGATRSVQAPATDDDRRRLRLRLRDRRCRRLIPRQPIEPPPQLGQLRKRLAGAIRSLNRNDERDHREYRDQENHAALHGSAKDTPSVPRRPMLMRQDCRLRSPHPGTRFMKSRCVDAI